MKQRVDICRLVKCNNLNTEENKCSFDDCIFTTEDLKAKAESVENAEFGIMLMKFAGATAVILLVMLMMLKKAGFI